MNEEQDTLRRGVEGLVGAPLELILKAVLRGGPLFLRGLRGALAEAAFEDSVVPRLRRSGWRFGPIIGDPPYDFLPQDDVGEVRIQVKMQRRKGTLPMRFPRSGNADLHAVETWRTRTGEDTDGNPTRYYAFGSFDILAVCLQASDAARRWEVFAYTLERWCMPHEDDPRFLRKLQPVGLDPEGYWTLDINQAIHWLRRGEQRSLAGMLGNG